MRVTQSMYYNNIFSTSNSRLNQQLFDVNKQIASGLQIQYASDDVRTFTETMRLDNELATITQTKKSAESGYKVANQTDVTMNEFTGSMNRMRTLLVQAANDTNDDTSRAAIAAELRGIEKNLRSLANTSINGQFLFAGSAVDTKPIADDGSYQGNDVAMNSFLGSNNQQKYNITGAELFLGEEPSVSRDITTNVLQTPNAPGVNGRSITKATTIEELMGTSPSAKHYFYLRGVQSDGTNFSEKIELDNTDSMDLLLQKIGEAYGNTGSVDVVNVSLNPQGQIQVEDKLKGSSKLDFHLVGATDFDGAGADDANVTDISLLDNATTDYATASSGTGSLYVREFIKSGMSPIDGVTAPEGNLYDTTQFVKDGSKLSATVAQIVKNSNETIKDGNAFAQPSTLLSEVADISKGTLDTADDTLAGTQFILKGTDVNGNTYDVTIDLDKSVSNGGVNGSTFTVAGVTYDIFNMQNPRVAADADEVTYQQLMDIINMTVTGTLPATNNNADDYDNAIKASGYLGATTLSYDGRLEFNDLNVTSTSATIALYDAKSGNFAKNIDSNGDGTLDTASTSSMVFNANNALTIRDPKTDFFTAINEMIEAVESFSNNPDADANVKRNVGIQNAITMMDDLQDHTFRIQSVVGAQSNTLSNSVERIGILEISTMSLRSSVIDTDLAEASLKLSQLTLNYQAMLSTVGKVSQLSLVNYL
ncbi:flagellar biosynthesis protein FlgL [Sulfurimonas sp. SAG-AH-194-L11]|nr:flagellar biosynthesis protein FlgL [Sulfurimonas sp. SAG-AH-194-L11]MDF1876881.1 flagellar biosynthesis protein FlgL [Sulfurimonas sp. SAG-AH-194-L11]